MQLRRSVVIIELKDISKLQPWIDSFADHAALSLVWVDD